MSSPNHFFRNPARLFAAGTSVLWAWRIVLLVVVLAVSYLALTPTPPYGVSTGWDKLNHGLAFAALSLSGCFGFSNSRFMTLGAIGAILAYGGFIEIAQSFVPGRTAEWGDFVADAVGTLLGATVALSALKSARNPVKSRA